MSMCLSYNQNLQFAYITFCDCSLYLFKRVSTILLTLGMMKMSQLVMQIVKKITVKILVIACCLSFCPKQSTSKCI